VRAAPAVSRANRQKKTHTSIQVQRKQSGLPCAMVLTVSFVLSPVTGFLATVISEKLASQKLDASIGASGPHDFAVRLTRRSSIAHPRPPHPAAHVRDDRETPLVWGGMAGNKPVIWVGWKQEYFCSDNWTGQIRLKWREKFGCARTCRNAFGGPHEPNPGMLYSITSSARARKDGENSRPIAFATLRFTTRSNLVGCSTGRSSGFAPRRILSTYSAARRNRLGVLGP
jgi:hypothetical protein